MKNLFVLVILLGCAAYAAKAQIAAGGNYTLDQSVMAAGGGASAGGTFKIEGTAGQAAAGTKQQNSAFKFQPGFWTAAPLAPTAASVSVSGRITTANGRGIRNVSITFTDANGTSHRVFTGSYGYYEFAQIESGQTVIISVSSKRFTFAQPNVVLNITADMSEINFISDEN